MKYECQLPPEYGQEQFGGPNPAISPALASREDFLLGFVPTGDLDHDLTTFLVGTGEEQLLVVSRQQGLPLRDLAAMIRHNHQDELANLKRGKRPLWAQKNQHWSPDRRAFYAHLLELECKVLDSILNQDTGLSRRSAA